MKHGKKYVDSVKAIDKTKNYEPEEALQLVIDTAKANFDETVEAHIRLGVDSRHADQQVRGAVVLPNGTGKKVRVAVFAKGDQAKAAEEAGADIVGAEDLAARIQNENFLDFDVIYRNTMPRRTSSKSMILLRRFFSRKTNAPTRKLTSTLPRRIMLTTLTSEPSMLRA